MSEELCPQCGFSLESRTHLEGLGKVHNPDFVRVSKAEKARERAERLEAQAAAEAAQAAILAEDPAFKLAMAEARIKELESVKPEEPSREERIKAALDLLVAEGIVESMTVEATEDGLAVVESEKPPKKAKD